MVFPSGSIEAIGRCNESYVLVHTLPTGFVTAVRKFAALYENDVRFDSGSTTAIRLDWLSKTLVVRLPSASTWAVGCQPSHRQKKFGFPARPPGRSPCWHHRIPPCRSHQWDWSCSPSFRRRRTHSS